MKDKEIEAFESRFGYKPTAIRVAIDALAVYVHKDSPLEALSIAQVDAAFSETRRCGATVSVDSWGDFGLSGSWEERPIQLYGRNSVSGTYGYFKKVGLCSGDFKGSVNEQPGSASVVQAVASSLNGIGYSGIGYVTSGVKPLSLSKDGGEAIEATPEKALSGEYPLSRYLYVYVNKKPGEPLPPLEREFIKLKDGSILTDGNSKIRELNNYSSWAIPEDNAKTINGLITEYLDQIPQANLCIQIENYRFEVLELDENLISKIKIVKI